MKKLLREFKRRLRAHKYARVPAVKRHEEFMAEFREADPWTIEPKVCFADQPD